MSSATFSTPLRAGLAACGGISLWTISMARASRDFDIVAVQDIHTPTVTSFGEKYGISRQHCRYEDLLTDDIDFIIINSPNDKHLEQVRLAVEAGKPCLVQKPMARNLAEAEEMVRIVRNHGVKAGIVFDEIAKPINHQIRDMIQNGIIGTPCLIHTCYTHDTYLKTPPSSDNWRYDPSRVGGAAFIQLAIHHINLIAWLLGKEVTEVSALGRCGHTVFEDETTVAVAAFSEGAVASFSASYATNGIHITVHGTQGYIHLFTDTLIVRGKQNFEGEIFHYANGGKESVISLHSLSQRIEQLQYKYEIHSCFARWVSKNEEYPCPLEAGLPDMRVLDAVYRSKEEGRRIQI